MASTVTPNSVLDRILIAKPAANPEETLLGRGGGLRIAVDRVPTPLDSDPTVGLAAIGTARDRSSGRIFLLAPLLQTDWPLPTLVTSTLLHGSPYTWPFGA